LPHEQVVDYTLVFPSMPPSEGPSGTFLSEISDWISQNFDLPAFDRPPAIAIAAPAEIAAMPYRRALGDRWAAVAGSEVVAVYDEAAQTIYLPAGWRGATPAQTSVLVHEMVHHLQSRAGRKYECAQAREKLAFLAQQRWLERFGRSLESEFGLDGFTLLVRTSCGP
jgi:hypothetical protein